MSNQIPATRLQRSAFALGLVSFALGCWLIGEAAARVSPGDALLLIAGSALAVFSLVTAWRMLRARDSRPTPGVPAAPPDTEMSRRAPTADQLNQALCAITANADAIERLIDRQPPDLDEVRAALADIVHDAARASYTIQAAEGLPPMTPVADDIDVAQLVDQFVHRFRDEMATRRVICEVETAGHLPGIRGFREQLLQLFTKLATLLLEAVPGHEWRERRLRVRASRQDGAVAISIEDSGAAIRPESAARLCDPSCRRIVRAHGGHIAVTRAAGGGAALQVILPVSS